MMEGEYVIITDGEEYVVSMDGEEFERVREADWEECKVKGAVGYTEYILRGIWRLQFVLLSGFQKLLRHPHQQGFRSDRGGGGRERSRGGAGGLVEAVERR